MAAAVSAAAPLPTSSLSFTPVFKPLLVPNTSAPFRNPFSPNFAPKWNPNAVLTPRLRISHTQGVAPILACALSLEDGNFEKRHESGPSSWPPLEATIDLQLPRRSLMVQFTCNLCGERTQKLINRLAYERGAVFVQCVGCHRRHKLADNLGLVVEYDLRKDIHVDSNTDHV